jgi:uncharacterized protein
VRIAVWLAVALLSPPLAAQQPIPALTGRVVDLTATLDAAERDALERKLAALEAREGSQVVVLMVPTTAPEAIEAYSLRVAEAWQIGRGKVEDGIVLVVAKDDRRLRLEVGYGLEGAVPDALAKRIISERIAPRFYEGDFAAGINDGVDALTTLIQGEELPPPVESRRGNGEDPLGALPVIFFIALVVAPVLKRMFGTLFGSLAVGVGSGLVAWLISSILVLSLGLGFVAFVLALAGAFGGPGRWSSGGGWGGRRGGFGGGFGGGGGGGFRGGGGGFGGGGASWRW